MSSVAASSCFPHCACMKNESSHEEKTRHFDWSPSKCQAHGGGRGGVGGLTFVNSLRKRARDCNAIESLPRITVFCRRSLTRGLGLWPNSVRVLHKVGLGNVLNSSGLKIPSAAYRSASGQWLSKCSATQENHERVVSLLEKDLLTALHQNI